MIRGMLFLAAVFILNLVVISTAKSVWSYKDVKGWANNNAICNDGLRQSPIDIDTNTAVKDNELAADKLVFDRYEGEFKGKFKNNGHTVQFDIDSSIETGKRPRIHGGGLTKEGFVLEQFHFHWGTDSSSSSGSEHTIDGKAAPLEVHFVHRNLKYNSIGDALGYVDGLAVVGFLFDDTDQKEDVTNDYSQVTDLIANVTEQGSDISATLDFSKFVPKVAADSTGRYFRYQGSLTTPPCSQVVTWTVFPQSLPMLKETLNMFSKATMQNKTAIVNNFRPVLGLKGRVVKSVDPSSPQAAGVSGAPVMITVNMALAAVVGALHVAGFI